MKIYILLLLLATTSSCRYFGDKCKKGGDDRVMIDIGCVNDLIEKIVIRDEDFIEGDIREGKLEDAIQAISELKEMGSNSFPLLCDYLKDGRPSVSLSSVLSSTVGDVCYDIITSQLYNYPDNYSCSIVRRGADGKYHERPCFGHNVTILKKNNIDKWVSERIGKTIVEMQIEVLEAVLFEENRIGFASEEDRRIYISPLESHLAYLQKAAKGSGSGVRSKAPIKIGGE